MPRLFSCCLLVSIVFVGEFVAPYDCTYGEDERKEGHMNIEDNCLLRDKLISLKVADNNTKHIISHLAHSLKKTHNELCEMGNKYSFIVAYDGMEIEI